jgi:hypothetical protein
MSNMSNFYGLFEVYPNASIKEIVMAYENKITKFNNIKKLTKEQIYEIKMLKIGLHILVNSELREKYNKTFKNLSDNKESNKESNKEAQVNEPLALNSNNDDSLDSLFKVDNSWMKDVNIAADSKQFSKKMGFETNIGDRVFSMSNFNKRPGFSSDFESELRKPMQGREDKSSQMINNNK